MTAPARRCAQGLSSESGGFSLVEALVALGMVAVALAAGLALQASLVARAEREPDALLAEVCARNQLAWLQMQRQLPAPGQAVQPCTQAGRTLAVVTTVSEAGGGDFRQVQVQVRAPTGPGQGPGQAVLLSLATVLGRH